MPVSYCNHRRPFRTALLLTFLLGSLALLACSCRQVGDVAGVVSLRGSDVGECIEHCNNIAKDRAKFEELVHKLNIFICRTKPTCLTAENARHEQILLKIEAARLACIQECHHQGGATGGR